MQSVYVSKAQHDRKCQEAKEPGQTLEQHLYVWLGKRYTLKSVVQEWACAIFKAIQKHARRECDVAAFGKMLQNTLAESFPDVQERLKQTVIELLRSNLEDRHPHRPQAEIEAMWRTRSRCGVPLSECEEVVKYMYNEGDAQEIMLRMQHASQNASEVGPEALAPDSVSLKDMMTVLQFYQMRLTESFLSDFIDIFREELVRRVGFVKFSEQDDTAGLAQLAIAQAQAKNNMRSFKKGATFSQCVDIFTGLISARWGALTSLS